MEISGKDAPQFETEHAKAKYADCVGGLDKVVALAKKYDVQTAFGTDMMFDPKFCEKQGKFLTKLKRWYTPYETHTDQRSILDEGDRQWQIATSQAG